MTIIFAAFASQHISLVFCISMS